MRGGSPARKCRSEPFFSRISPRYASIFAMAASARSEVEFRQDRSVGDELREQLLVARVSEGVVGIDFLGLDRGEQRLVEELHAVFLAGLQLCRNLVRLICH